MGNISVFSMHWSARASLLVLALICLVFTWSPIQSYTQYDADLVTLGEWWRPFTAWFTQLNFRHWLVNGWAVVLMALLLPRSLNVRIASGFLIVWFGASALLWLSDYHRYLGLSGLLYGWLLWSIYCSPHYSLVIRVMLATIIAIKVGYDQWLSFQLTDTSLSNWLGSDIAYEAHGWGLWVAAVTVFVDFAIRRVSSTA